MARYHVPAFEIETIEDLRNGQDGEMQYARLTNGWDIWIPAFVAVEKVPEPLPELEDGYYYIAGVMEAHKRTTDSEGKPFWTVWNGNDFSQGSPFIYYKNEDDADMRARLHFVGDH